MTTIQQIESVWTGILGEFTAFPEFGRCNPPAHSSDIQALEGSLGLQIDPMHRALLEFNNGQHPQDVFFQDVYLLSSTQVAAFYEQCEKVTWPDFTDYEAEPDTNVIQTNKIWQDGWVPLFIGVSGDPVICVDLDPASSGVGGRSSEFLFKKVK